MSSQLVLFSHCPSPLPPPDVSPAEVSCVRAPGASDLLLRWVDAESGTPLVAYGVMMIEPRVEVLPVDSAGMVRVSDVGDEPITILGRAPGRLPASTTQQVAPDMVCEVTIRLPAAFDHGF